MEHTIEQAFNMDLAHRTARNTPTLKDWPLSKKAKFVRPLRANMPSGLQQCWAGPGSSRESRREWPLAGTLPGGNPGWPKHPGPIPAGNPAKKPGKGKGMSPSTVNLIKL